MLRRYLMNQTAEVGGQEIGTVSLSLEFMAEDKIRTHSHNFSLCKQSFCVSLKQVKSRCGALCLRLGRDLSFWFGIHSHLVEHPLCVRQ